MFLLKCCVSQSPYVDEDINWIQQKAKAIELLPFASHVTGYESDRIFMGLSRTKSESTYPKVSKHSRIRDCFGSGMATVPLTKNSMKKVSV
jgi:hypothetical protein